MDFRSKFVIRFDIVAIKLIEIFENGGKDQTNVYFTQKHSKFLMYFVIFDGFRPFLIDFNIFDGFQPFSMYFDICLNLSIHFLLKNGRIC